jgi:hypothetical protein
MADYNAVPNSFQFQFQLLIITALAPLDAGMLKISFFYDKYVFCSKFLKATGLCLVLPPMKTTVSSILIIN